MRRPAWPRRGLVAIAIGAGGLAVLAIALAIIYPRVGAWTIRKKATAKATEKLGREITFGAIDVRFGHAVLHDVALRGPSDRDTPLVHIDRIDVRFDAWDSLVGKIKLGDAALDGVTVTVRRDAEGHDNVRDLVERLRGGDATPHDDAGGSGMRPTKITVTHGRLVADDEKSGTTVLVGDGDALWTREGLVVHARGITATTTAAPKATVATIEIRKQPGEAPIVVVDGGELALWPRMTLSGIGGQIVADPDHPGHYVIDLAGGWGGVGGKLWTAKGGFDPAAATASLDLEAAKFQLDRLAPILASSPVVDYQTTSIDTNVHVDFDRSGARFAGAFHLSGLNVGHPYIADKEVRDLDLQAQIAGSFDRATHTIELTRGDFATRGVPFSVTGKVVKPRAAPPAPSETPPGPNDGIATVGPHGISNLELRVVVPPIDCQRAIDAVPTEMAPYMAGYKLKGVFTADVHLAVDWANLDATELGGKIGIDKCKVMTEPEDSPKRLLQEFDQYVETDKGDWDTFIVGPSNPDFVPIDQISPYVIKSIMSTEDSGFYKHHGFIPTEFRTALVNNLKAGKFVQGASSITMQMVKNVLLYREKTLARKLQELFLTWHVENTLTKDRIMEIYLNVIEYGPGLYGIGPAAKHYFGKAAKDLSPTEAAFFSSILPDPKGRYRQYCQGTLTKWTTGKIERILAIMLKRDRLTQEEYDKAIATPLVFVKDGNESEEDCLKRVKAAIKNARSTNPLKK